LLAVLFADSFEDGEWNGMWTEDSQNDWFRSTHRAIDGSYAAEVDGRATDATLTMANSLDMTSYGSAELTFSWFIERNWDSGEYIALDLFDGSSWNEVRSLRGNVDQENVWHQETVTIDGNYLVQDFQARFRAKVSSSKEDGHVDNVQIAGTPAGSDLAINDVQLAEGDSGTTAFVFTVSRSGDISQQATVDFATASGTATEGVDFIGTNGTLTFPAGDSNPQAITVQVNGDTDIEPDETFSVNLSNATNATTTDGSGQGTILDDDTVPTISYPDFSDSTGLNLVGDAAITPDNGLRLTSATAVQTGGAWFSAEKQFVSVAFETTFQFQLHGGNQDGGTNGTDGFVFAIQNTSPSELTSSSGNLGYNGILNSLVVEFDTNQDGGTILDPSASHISVHTNGSGYNFKEEAFSIGSFDTTTAGILLDDGNIHTARLTYTPGMLSIFLDDLSSPVLQVSVNLADLLDLDTGRAWVGFTGATRWNLWQNHDILNWEYTLLADTTTSIGIDNVSLAEGDTGTSQMSFVVTRLGDTSGTTTANWSTADGTAIAGSDYESASGQVVFAPGRVAEDHHSHH